MTIRIYSAQERYPLSEKEIGRRRDNRGLLRLRNGGEDDGLLRAGRREIDGGGADWAVSGRRRDVGPCRWRWI